MSEVQFNYEGKNFVVCGASSGIGKQIALELAQAGANVLCLARRVEVMEQMKSEQGKGKIIPAFVDVIEAKSADWDKIFKDFVAEYGKISGGVYTAGISQITPFRGWNEELAQRIMNTSYWGMLRFIQSASKKKFAFDGASFVVFSSVSGHLGTQGLLFYASAKSAVMTAVKVIAREISKNSQRINSISPGFVTNTKMTSTVEIAEFNIEDNNAKIAPFGLGTVEKVSGMALFLLSDRTSWITGTDIIVDEGQILGVE